ncbi:MAG: hypothetical protein NVS3B20_21710 [Polyangiales bacterium]
MRDALVSPDSALSDSVGSGTDSLEGGLKLLYSGPVAGGRLKDWAADSPYPLVVLASRTASSQDWQASLVSVHDDGALGENVAEKVRVYGWPIGASGAPNPLYDGPLDSKARVPAWNDADPRPLLAMGRISASGDWVATLLQIGADGSMSNNAAERLIVYGFGASPPMKLYDGPASTARLPAWSSDAPRPFITVGRTASVGPTWQMTLGTVAKDGALTDVFVERLRVWGW